jgi:hypothetical protein
VKGTEESENQAEDEVAWVRVERGRRRALAAEMRRREKIFTVCILHCHTLYHSRQIRVHRQLCDRTRHYPRYLREREREREREMLCAQCNVYVCDERT